MEFGFGAPSRGPLASPENLVALAQKGEELGFEILSVSDHIVVPNSIASVYPVQRERRVRELGGGGVHGTAYDDQLSCRNNIYDQAADFGYGASASESGAYSEDTVHY